MTAAASYVAESGRCPTYACLDPRLDAHAYESIDLDKLQKIASLYPEELSTQREGESGGGTLVLKRGYRESILDFKGLLEEGLPPPKKLKQTSKPGLSPARPSAGGKEEMRTPPKTNSEQWDWGWDFGWPKVETPSFAKFQDLPTFTGLRRRGADYCLFLCRSVIT